MKISDAPRPAAATRRGAVAPRRDKGFSTAAGRSDAGNEAAPATPLAATDAILALQEVVAGPAERRRALERGHDLLDELEQLRLAMIEGWLSEAALRRLAALVDGPGLEVEDPRLGSLLEEVEVRAAVEIAKRRDSKGDDADDVSSRRP